MGHPEEPRATVTLMGDTQAQCPEQRPAGTGQSDCLSSDCRYPSPPPPAPWLPWPIWLPLSTSPSWASTQPSAMDVSSPQAGLRGHRWTSEAEVSLGAVPSCLGTRLQSSAEGVTAYPGPTLRGAQPATTLHTRNSQHVQGQLGSVAKWPVHRQGKIGPGPSPLSSPHAQSIVPSGVTAGG